MIVKSPLINSRVSFDDTLRGLQTGVVKGVITDISNGQSNAIVEYGPLPGMFQAVPVTNLKFEQPKNICVDKGASNE